MQTSAKIIFITAGLLVGISHGAKAEDACAGQTWPNYSDDCIDQIVATICKAGGGGSTCGSSAAKQLVVSGTIKANMSPRTVRLNLAKQPASVRRALHFR